MRSLVGMALLSAATLLLQVALTRVFSIAQFYHFAFLIVSLALLGFGASGSLLVLFPRLRGERYTAWYAAAFAASTVLAYLFVNHLAFDSYSIAWDATQFYLLIANLLALSLPFVFAGALIAVLLTHEAKHAGRIYAANLLGSALGSVSGPMAITLLGSERAVLLCAALGMIAGLVLNAPPRHAVTVVAGLGVGLSLALLFVFPAPFEIQLSPYKALSQYRLNPDAEITVTYQNAYSRVDVVESPTIHSAQGLSLSYFGDLPPQVGLLADGSNLQPVSQAAQTDDSLLQALPVAVAYSILDNPRVVLLGSAGGMEGLAALANGAEHVTIVEPNELIYETLTGQLRDWAGLADNPRVALVRDEIRSFTSGTTERFNLVEVPLADNFRPISSGAFTLTEDYTLTVDAFRDYLSLLNEDGVFVIHRWLQTPPSECLRTLGLILEALDTDTPLARVVAFRSFQHVTFVVKPSGYTTEEVDRVLAAIEDLRYDLLLAPEMPEDMINRYARLDADVYHDAFLQLAGAPDRAAFYATYGYEISPPTDNKPFFFHFFRWEQTPAVIENLGRRWQPFGGSGYFVLIALLVFALIAALLFVIVPVLLKRRFRTALTTTGAARVGRVLGYFIAIGLAFLLVEVSLIQQYILLLGQPTLAIAAVIGALLFFSGIGSAVSSRVRWRAVMFMLVALLLVYPALIQAVTPLLLPLTLPVRLLIVTLLIAPVGLLMGMPFPLGISALREREELVPWAWAANGSASVVSAVLAAMLSLSFGFTAVLWIGGAFYLLAALIRSRA